ncbi:RNA polymerase sigma factor [Alteromonas sp. RKMC-009]|uniref:RNA polymerase sigma factor n=1 Tax=Alteromonas sp. RKMC-009 TaxID=2267264 RepID=UPI0013756A17|nr:sigma-70 family RNA polymerase sigma factor [Alteromonas sp. RKMC-009]
MNRVYALCYRLTGDKSLAEDATQEVFIQVWRKLGNYQGRSLFSTWLDSVTANVTISYMRKQKSWMRRLFDTAEQIDNEAGTASCSSEVDLERYIRQLPERARGQALVNVLSRQHEQQKQQLLVRFQDQTAVTDDWQTQIQELEDAAAAVKLALKQDPDNTALLGMLQHIYQQQLLLIERVHAPKWQQI